MPIDVQTELRTVSQEEFARVAYDAMSVFFEVHNEMGRLFGERIYKAEIARRHGGIEIEVPVNVSFDCFSKRYWIDMLVCSCAVFEVKTGSTLAPEHRAQLTNYLLLTGLPRGKLVNVRPEAIEHEFVNALESRNPSRILANMMETSWAGDPSGSTTRPVTMTPGSSLAWRWSRPFSEASGIRNGHDECRLGR